MRPSKIIAIAATLLAAAPATAGTLIVAGDATIAFRTNTGVTSGAASLAGNVTFAKTILASGTNVTVFGQSDNFSIPGQLTSAYNSFAGVTATSFTGTITAAQLANTDLFMAFFPSRAFTLDEAGVINDFMRRGGTFFVAGESTRDPFGNPLGLTSNNRINDLLGNLGSSIRLGDASLDISDQFATGGEIVSDPLTAGVSSFGYGLTTTVSGGQALFLTNDLQPFVSYAAVPEPATWAMMIGGFGLVGGAMRRRRSTMTVRALA